LQIIDAYSNAFTKEGEGELSTLYFVIKVRNSLSQLGFLAIKKTHDAFDGEAERTGISDEHDAIDLFNSVREELSKKNLKDS
jgi:hypothetical protein